MSGRSVAGRRFVRRGVPPTNDTGQLDELCMAIFMVSGNLVGVCLTALGVLQVVNRHTLIEPIADNLLAFNALLFMLCCLLAFWNLRLHGVRARSRAAWMLEALFVVGLAMLVVVGGLVAFDLA